MTSGATRHAVPAPILPPAPSTIDLHTHTLRSDGVLEPAELARQAAAAGVKLLAITDHDTLAGVRELQRGATSAGTSPRGSALPAGLELLPGVEINAVIHGRPELRESEVHVLGLGVDPGSAALEARLATQRAARRTRFDAMTARLRDLGFAIDRALERLPASGEEDALGRPRLARALISLGAATSIQDAFEQYLSRGRPAYVPREGLGPVEAIAAITEAGGVAALAHFSEAQRLRSVVVELAERGLRGLEVYYRTFDAETVASVGRVARELRLVATGGSDYHGDGQSYAEVHAGLWVPPEAEPPLRAAIEAALSAAAARA